MLYDYKCSNCGMVFEMFNRVADRKLSECPTCGYMANLKFSPTSLSTALLVFKPYIDPHIADEPVKIESASQKRRLLKQHGLCQL